MYKLSILVLCMVSATILSAGCQTQPKTPEKENLSSAEVLERRQKILSMNELALEKLYAENPAAKAEVESANGYAVFDINTVNALLVVGSKGKGLLTDNKTKKQTYMLTVRAGTGPGLGYQHLYQIFVFKNEAAMAQFKVGDAAGGDVSASATLGIAGKQYSFNPYITVYQVSDKGFAVQANWGGTAYFVDPNLN